MSAKALALGIKAQSYMDAGEYVPDGVTNAMVRDRLTHEDARAGLHSRWLPANS